MSKLSKLPVICALVVALGLTLSSCGKPAPDITQQPGVQQTEQVPSFKENLHYRRVSNIASHAAAKPFLVQYFWFGCGHCQQFEPVLHQIMAQNPQLQLVRKHAAVAPNWQLDARIFFTLQQMGHEAVTDPLFEIYIAQGQPGPLELQQFLQQHNVDLEQFFELANNSEQVIARMLEANTEMEQNQIGGVPAIVVNGQYLILHHQDTNNIERYQALVRYLMQKAD
ncbi:DsbA family protein [Arsukibacterium sp.]|uniref:DsbA family protein n=1 Tax=Arsukibacterium sp. TaxID=1977258 RepID=UPI002FD88B60